jgi:hypothetical protein
LKQLLKIDVDDWFGNRRIRLCSPAARGFLIDLRCLCADTGYLHLDGKPLDDTQVARLVGESLDDVQGWMTELGEAGAYSVNDEGLCFEDLVKNAEFVNQARESGARGGRARANGKADAQDDNEHGRAAQPKTGSSGARNRSRIDPAPSAPTKRAKSAKKKAAPPLMDTALSAAPSGDGDSRARGAAPKAHAREWYETPAGWIRKAQEQAIPWGGNFTGSNFDDLQVALCIKLPSGPWCEEPFLTKRLRKQVNARLPQAGGNFNKEVR